MGWDPPCHCHTAQRSFQRWLQLTNPKKRTREALLWRPAALFLENAGVTVETLPGYGQGPTLKGSFLLSLSDSNLTFLGALLPPRLPHLPPLALPGRPRLGTVVSPGSDAHRHPEALSGEGR